MTMHEKVSGVWKEIDPPHEKVSGVWKGILEGYERVSGAWKQFYAAITYNITPAGGGGYGFGGPVAGYFTFHSDGTTTYANGLLADGTGQWVDGAPETDIGVGRYVRLVTSTGVLDGPGSLSAGTWYQLNADRYFAVTTEGAPDADEWTGTAEIGEDGSTALYSVSFAIGAQSDTI